MKSRFWQFLCKFTESFCLQDLIQFNGIFWNLQDILSGPMEEINEYKQKVPALKESAEGRWSMFINDYYLNKKCNNFHLFSILLFTCILQSCLLKIRMWPRPRKSQNVMEFIERRDYFWPWVLGKDSWSMHEVDSILGLTLKVTRIWKWRQETRGYSR